MVRIENISDMLKSLIELYDFNKNTLSKYLGVSVEQIEDLARGNGCLPQEPAFCSRVLTKTGFLYFGALEDKDLKLSGFLEALITYHKLSKKTIAKMAGVEISAIDKMLANPPEKMEIETKYKIAATVMALRFFLKDCEPPI